MIPRTNLRYFILRYSVDNLIFIIKDNLDLKFYGKFTI